MKILILEDNVERQKQFRKNLVGHNVTITDSSKTAISKLTNEKWDVLFLDHDLGGQVNVPSGENTGFEVAEFLKFNKSHMPPNIIVHSINVPGSQNIIATLPKAIHIPFAWTGTNLKKIGLI